jgi:hypothetical protein
MYRAKYQTQDLRANETLQLQALLRSIDFFTRCNVTAALAQSGENRYAQNTKGLNLTDADLVTNAVNTC